MTSVAVTNSHLFHSTGMLGIGQTPQTEMETLIEYQAVGGSQAWWWGHGPGPRQGFYEAPEIHIQAIRCRFLKANVEHLTAPGGGRGMKVIRQRPVGSWFDVPLDGLDEEVMSELRQDILDGLEDKV